MQPADPAAVDTGRPRRFGEGVFRHALVPGLLALSVASWIFRPEALRWLHQAKSAIDPTAAVLLLSIAAILVGEALYPHRRDWSYRLLRDPIHGWPRLIRDLFYFLVIAQLSGAVIKVVGARLTDGLSGVTWGHALWPAAAPFVVKVLLAFLALELGAYALHRTAHHVEFLWRFHSTHHVITEISSLKALRTHPVDNLFFYVIRNVPLLLLGAGVDEVLAATYFASVLGILSHANMELHEGPLGWVVNFPRFHRVHHSSAIDESRSNFGCHTVIWDRVFGSFRTDPREPLVVGVAPVGPRTLWQELFWPFYRRVS